MSAGPARGTVPADADERWAVDESVDLHREDWVLALRADTVRRPGGGDEAPFRRWVLEHPGAAAVVALDEEDRVLCLRQYRHPVGRRLLELPAGLCDEAGEDPLAVARRELREEAALQATSWTHLVTAYSSPGISAEAVHLYLAQGLSAADRSDFVLEHEEADMELVWLPLANLRTAILDGRVTDGHLMIGVLTYLARREAGWHS